MHGRLKCCLKCSSQFFVRRGRTGGQLLIYIVISYVTQYCHAYCMLLRDRRRANVIVCPGPPLKHPPAPARRYSLKRPELRAIGSCFARLVLLVSYETSPDKILQQKTCKAAQPLQGGSVVVVVVIVPRAALALALASALAPASGRIPEDTVARQQLIPCSKQVDGRPVSGQAPQIIHRCLVHTIHSRQKIINR